MSTDPNNPPANPPANPNPKAVDIIDDETGNKPKNKTSGAKRDEDIGDLKTMVSDLTSSVGKLLDAVAPKVTPPEPPKAPENPPAKKPGFFDGWL